MEEKNMQRFIRNIALALVLLIGSAAASAETLWFKANSYAYKYVNDYGKWTEWTDWLKCDVSIRFDLDDDIIVIYSNRTQIYAIFDGGQKFTDSSGGSQVRFDVIDQDYDKGTIRLRIERNGNSQIYVDFANATWVYNVVRAQ